MAKHSAVGILLFLIFGGDSLAQVRVKFKDVAWENDPKSTVVPEEWRDLDAVCLERRFTYDFNNQFERYNRQNAEVYVKLSLRSPRAVEDFRFIPVPILRGIDVTAIDCRITKLDGRVIDVRSKFLKRHETEIGNKYYPKGQYRLFEVPMLEPGDQFEYVIRFVNFPFPERFYFHTNLPTVSSRYQLIAMTRFEVLVSSEQGAPEPIQNEEFYSRHRKYEMKMLQPLLPVEGCLLHEAYPNIRQVVKPPFIEDNFWPSNWGAFYREIDQTQYRLNRSYDARMEETLRQLWSTIPEGNQLEKIKAFHAYVNQNMTLVKRRNDAPISFGNDLRFKQTTDRNLLLMYDDIFRRFDLPYRMIWASDRYLGNLDTTLLSDQIVPHRFFAVFVDDDTLFLAPKSQYRTYAFNEFPPEAIGQNSVWFHNDDDFNYDFFVLSKNTTADYRSVTIRSSRGVDGTYVADERLSGNYKFFLSSIYQNGKGVRSMTTSNNWLRTRPNGVQSVEMNLYTSPSERTAGFNYLLKEESEEIALSKWIDFYGLQLLKLNQTKPSCAVVYPLSGTEEYQLIIPKNTSYTLKSKELNAPGLATFETEVIEGLQEVIVRCTLTIEKDQFNKAELDALFDFLTRLRSYLDTTKVELSTP